MAGDYGRPVLHGFLGDFLRVLLTNDDGVEAQGLAAAREALLHAGIEVITAAPDVPRSGTSRSASFRRPISLTRRGGTDANPIYAVNGTPTDTVRAAILSGTAGEIDAVVSGINEGINLGDDATYSSTLGAAMEGALLGYPSIAASQQTTDGRFRLIDLTGYDFETGARILARLAQIVIEDRAKIPPRSVLNLNSPGKPAKGLQLAHFDERIWGTESVYGVWYASGERSGISHDAGK
jgi:5'-nucleotidase